MASVVEFYVWNKKEEYMGRIVLREGDVPDYPFYEEIEHPPCPGAPAARDGWYIVRVLYSPSLEEVLRQKCGNKVYSRKNEFCDFWDNYEVIAYLGPLSLKVEDLGKRNK